MYRHFHRNTLSQMQVPKETESTRLNHYTIYQLILQTSKGQSSLCVYRFAKNDVSCDVFCRHVCKCVTQILLLILHIKNILGVKIKVNSANISGKTNSAMAGEMCSYIYYKSWHLGKLKKITLAINQQQAPPTLFLVSCFNSSKITLACEKYFPPFP